jgi:hypothetical protein
MALTYAAISCFINAFFESALGFVIKGYAFGRRIRTHGSARPGRAGLITSLGRSNQPLTAV